MKKTILALLIVISVLGCSKPEAKLIGKWKSPTVEGFIAEFNQDHTGATSIAVKGHGGAMTTEMNKRPFKWEIGKDGVVKITEEKTAFYGKLSGEKLEVEVNGAKSVLDKSK